MAYWLDYSAAKLSGATIRNAGYSGVIRYIDSPANLARKHTDKAEYDSHRAAGLDVMLVMQTTTSASDGGYSVGQDHARRALAGANYLGYSGPIFFTNDRTTVPDTAAWRGYLNGAADVLGIDRVGAYGFRNAIDLAGGRATYFWQAGRKSDLSPRTHIWQDNNTQVTVGGIFCDRNLILKDLSSTEETLDVQERNALFSIYNALFKDNAGNLEQPTQGDQAIITRLVELQQESDAELVQVGEVAAKVDALDLAMGAELSELSSKLDNLQLGAVDYELLADKVAERLAQRLAD